MTGALGTSSVLGRCVARQRVVIDANLRGLHDLKAKISDGY